MPVSSSILEPILISLCSTYGTSLLVIQTYKTYAVEGGSLEPNSSDQSMVPFTSILEVPGSKFSKDDYLHRGLFLSAETTRKYRGSALIQVTTTFVHYFQFTLYQIDVRIFRHCIIWTTNSVVK
jgi:hypothetical protein